MASSLGPARFGRWVWLMGVSSALRAPTVTRLASTAREGTESHLTLARTVWRSVVRAEDVCVDATCGRGRDAAVLARLVGPEGRVIAVDADREAVETCRRQLESVQVKWQSHAERVEGAEEVGLVVFNLGYLPGAAVRRPTRAETTVEALENWALAALRVGGCASIVVYPGHAEGRREARALAALARALPDTHWRATEHVAVNHKPAAPYLLTLHKLAPDAPLGEAPDAARRALVMTEPAVTTETTQETADQEDDSPPPDDADEPTAATSTSATSSSSERAAPEEPEEEPATVEEWACRKVDGDWVCGKIAVAPSSDSAGEGSPQ
mmetsp:Transcript_2702/g.8488  ORF Transcript_2702/g.8488 Transcript_2702/m.8488 type:complete len:325 (+) Transcript_2702:24-998(+)